MAEFNLGTSLSADDYLDLVTAVNRRRNKSNAMLRGLGASTGTTPTMRTSSGFDTSLRAYSKAKDEEILSSIIGYAADHDFLDADGMFDENMFRDWFAEQGLPDKMYEKSAAEFRKRAGRFESGLAAAHQVKMRAGLYEKQQLDIKASGTEADKKRNEKYSERLADEIAMNAYDYVGQDMDRKTALETAIEEARGRFKKGEIAGGVDSPWARSAYVKAREKFNKLTKDTGTTKSVYDTRNAEQRWMTEDDIQAINKAEGAETILPADAEPADEQQVSMAMLSAASQVLYDQAVLTRAGITVEEARPLLQKWASDKSWLSAFDDILEEERILHQEWYKAYEGVMDRWYTTTTTGKVIGG